MQKPISIKPRLAGNPSKTPIYAKTVKSRSGGDLVCADPTATRAMVALMDMQAQMAGAASHFGGPSAFAEIMSALHAIVFTDAEKSRIQWHQKFHLVNDAGHCENGIYALKANYGYADLTLSSLKGFRSIHSQLTGHGEAHLFPEGVLISNGPLGSSIAQAEGLAFADKLTGNDRVTVCAISDGGCMEGEAREALASIPGLAARDKLNPFVMVISDNNTKLSGRIDKDSFSMKNTFESLQTLGWKTIFIPDGHDLQAVAYAIEDAIAETRKNPSKPIALHFKTIKGFGTKKTAESSSGAHGFPLNEPDLIHDFINELYGQNKAPAEFSKWADEMQELARVKKMRASEKPAEPATNIVNEKVQNGLAKALVAKRRAGLPVISVTSDLPGSTGLATFQKEFPDALLDVGVAESNMVSVAVGLSKMGYIPVVDTFAQFGVTKGALPLIMASLSEGPMICVFSHIGFQDAADGASHQALSYLSMLSSIPHVETYVLTSSSEAEALMGLALERFANDRKEGRVPNSVVFFLGRENFPSRYLSANHQYKLGEAQIIFDNTKTTANKSALTIVAMGALIHQAIEAAYTLEKDGISTIIVNPSIINHPDLTTIETALRATHQNLLTVEDHQVIGGMGAMITHALVQDGMKMNVASLGVKGEFGQSAYKAVELYKKHGLDAAAIAEAARQLVKNSK